MITWRCLRGGGYGVATLSRWPVEEAALARLPVDPPQARAGGSREPRGVLRVTVAAPWGQDFARGLEMIVVVEEKRSLIEVQVREDLYGTAMQPAVVGNPRTGGGFAATTSLKNVFNRPVGTRVSHDASAVRSALPNMRFYPAEVGGKKVKQLVQQSFQFRLDR